MTRPGHVVLAAIAAAVLAGCGSMTPGRSQTGIPGALLRQARPIGVGPRFQPPATGPITGRCRPTLGRRHGVHVEVFAANRVVIIPAGIGTRPPRTLSAGRISRARCYGDLVTLEPTGVILIRFGRRATVADLFRAWGQPLGRSRLASFRTEPGAQVSVFVAGRRWHGPPWSVPLAPHAEIVLEIGPHVPPHWSYTFPPGV